MSFFKKLFSDTMCLQLSLSAENQNKKYSNYNNTDKQFNLNNFLHKLLFQPISSLLSNSLSLMKNKIQSLLSLRTLQYIIPVLAILMFVLFPTSASAQTTGNLFQIASDDVSIKILKAIFGGLIDGGGTGVSGSDPMLEAIKMFNGGVLIIGGILAAYTILAGTLGTAHDGEMLGKKFSSVWIPIRYSVGTALVLPVVGGGYCVMQALVMWLVLQGIGLADQVWSSYVKNPTASANTTPSTVSKEKILVTATSAFKSSICYRAFDKVVSGGSVLKWSYTYSMTKTTTGYSYGDSSSLANSGCGTVSYPGDIEKNVAADGAGVNGTPSTNVGRLGLFNNIFAPVDMSAVGKAHVTQTDLLVKKMDDLAKKVIDGTLDNATATSAYNEIIASVDVYADNIKTTLASTNNGDAFAKIKEAAGNQGWILAGAWFTRIIQMNERMQVAANSTPTADFSSPTLDALLFSDASIYLRKVDFVLNKAKGAMPTDTFGIDKNTSKDKANNDGGLVFSVDGFVQKFEGWITGAVTGMNLYELKNDTRHPLIVLNDLGSRIVLSSIALMLVIATGSGLLAVFTQGAVPSFLSVIQMFMGLPIQALMSVALGCQYIIPNLPYMIWIGAIVGWTLLVIEAVIAAPLWAIMHLHPNGDDLTGRGGNGYMLVLSLLLRPVLMVFGMMASIVISSVIGEFINKTFFEVFANNTGAFTGFTSLLALIMGTMLYFIIMFTFVRKCFGIIHMLPDQLLKWIGGGGGGLGEFANEFGAASEKATGAGATLAGAATGAVINKGLGAAQKGLEKLQAKGGSEQGAEDTMMNRGLGKAMKFLNGGENLSVGGRLDAGGNDTSGTALRNKDGENSFSRMREQTQFRNDEKAKDLATQNAREDGNKEQENQDKAYDFANGSGASAFINSATSNFAASLGEKPQDAEGAAAHDSKVSSFSSGLKSALTNVGKIGRDAKSQFVNEFMGAQSNNFGGGSPAQAMQDIQTNIQNSASMAPANSKTSQFSGASDFIQAASMGENGLVDGKKANMFANSLNKMEQTYNSQGLNGAEKVNSVLEQVNQQAPEDREGAFGAIYNPLYEK